MESGNLLKLLICFVLSALLIASCANAEEKEGFDATFDTEAVTDDMGGYEFLYRYGGDGSQFGDGCLGYGLGTVLDDEARNRIQDVQTSLNCTVTVDMDLDAYDKINLSSASGSYYADAFWIQSDGIRDVAIVGCAVGISGLEKIDYTNTEKWGNYRLLEVFYYNDDLYGLMPCLWPEKADSSISALAVNEDLINRLALEDPRDYVENGTWTWKKVEEVLPSYYAEEGGEVRHYGWAADHGTYAQYYMFSNGSKIAEKNNAGEYVYCMYTDRCVLAMNSAKALLSGDVGYTIKDIGIDGFIDGRAVLACCPRGSLVGPKARVCNEMTNFGVIPYPVGPDAEPGLKVSVFNNHLGSLGLSVFAKDIDATEVIVDAIYEPIAGISGTDGLIDYLSTNFFFDRRDAVNYIGMLDWSVYNYRHNELHQYVQQYCDTSKTVTEYIDANSKAMNKTFEDHVLPSVRGVNAVWGEGTY